jgi:hypothetical protein
VNRPVLEAPRRLTIYGGNVGQKYRFWPPVRAVWPVQNWTCPQPAGGEEIRWEPLGLRLFICPFVHLFIIICSFVHLFIFTSVRQKPSRESRDPSSKIEAVCGDSSPTLTLHLFVASPQLPLLGYYVLLYRILPTSTTVPTNALGKK